MNALRIIVAGHVDHGKSTLIGRLLHAAGALAEGQEARARKASEARGQPFEWAFLLDSLQAERDQNITLDCAPARLHWRDTPLTLIDAPGHTQFIANALTGAAQADSALLVVAADEGMTEETRLHINLLGWLGLTHGVIAINKLDAPGTTAQHVMALSHDCEQAMREAGFTQLSTHPVSAREGTGLEPLLDALAVIPAASPMPPWRFQVQDIYRQGDTRIVAGRALGGEATPGMHLTFQPGGAQAVVKEVIPAGLLLDRPIFVERGQVASLEKEPLAAVTQFHARTLWLHADALEAGKRYSLHFGPQRVWAEAGQSVPRHGIINVTWRTRAPVALDTFAHCPATGGFAIVDGGTVVGAGTVSGLVEANNITPVASWVGTAERTARNGHAPGIFWFSGLPSSGKTTLAQAAQRLLFDRGMQICVLDGDNMRAGLTKGLTFSASDRAENLRRAAEAAKLLAESGMVVLCAFITPTQADRDAVQRIAGEYYHSVHVDAPLSLCETRDVKGLYARARAGGIAEFTGVSAPYEPPQDAGLVLDTSQSTVEENANQLAAFVWAHTREDA